MAFTVLRSGDEQKVNTLTKGSQTHPTIARLRNPDGTDGGWVVTWTGQDASETGIYMQRYDADGVPQFTSGGVAADRLVNTATDGSQIWSSVTGLSDGGWVVSWIDKGTDAPGVIHQQRYNAQGEAQSVTPTVVNPGFPAEETENIEMTALANGEWLVTWQSGDGSRYGVYQQRFSASGDPLLDAADQRVNTVTDGSQRYADVVTLADGGWLVTWVDGDAFDPTANIHMRRYDANGVASSVEVVTNARGMQTQPQVAALSGGGWLVVWYGLGADGSNDIFLKRYDAAGTPGETQVVNATTEGSQKDPHIAVNTDGSWVITWQSGADVYQRRYDSDGNTSGPDAVVPAWLGSQSNSRPQVVALSDGRWVVVWQNLDQDEFPGSGIAQRIFTPVAVEAVTDVAEYATGTVDDDTLNVEQNGLSLGDILDGGGDDDVDTLQMTWTGTIDLTLPTELLRFEALVGTVGDDRIMTDAHRIVQFATIDGGAGNNDVLELFTGDNYSLRNKTITGIEKILLSDYVNYKVTVDSVATALLIDGSASSGDTVRIVDTRSLTTDELIQLFSQGVDVIIDSNGQHTNALPQVAGFNGDQSRALVGGMTLLDTGAAAGVTDDLDRFRSLEVQITNRVAGEDRLMLIEQDGVTIAGNQVSVNGTLAGTLQRDGSGAAGLLIAFSADATEAMVSSIVRALAYVNTASGSFVVKQRNIAVTLTDAGGAQSTHDVQVDIALPTGGLENKAPTVDGTPTGVVQVADTGLISPFASMVLHDPDGDRLTVTVSFDKEKGRLIPQAGVSYDPDTGIYTIEGSAPYVTQVLKTLQFDPRDRNGPVGQGEETTFTVTVRDEGPGISTQVRVNAVIADRPPSQPTLSNNSVDELAKDGTPIGTLAAQDSNGQAVTYSLVGAGDAPFEIVGNELRVTKGIALDYEQTKAYTFTIRASAGGLSNDRVVTIAVNDVGKETTGGSASSDVIKGGAGRDNLGGGLGNDGLWGGLGNDVLKGGKGRDVFAFDTRTNKKTNVDKILDFKVKDDSIWLDNAVFTKIGKGSETKPGKLAKAMFWKGKEAHDASDRIIYDKKSGALYYDADGTGRSAQVKFATLKKGLSLTEKDFFVI
ncbi:cadherin repeat domain-containing protein [Microvirga splendida]|uniref:Cadherin repeat domain-containing protein n=1 Tax=Microvirga splendida TaxID=2795727 RepID=A0ABS0Y552_9HYPH|nr:cadherin repeat domain-containing protein [Microvirga splendida]MBJ6127055.1 cadherin repeat domain-containing protein [Microvirga splendida]